MSGGEPVRTSYVCHGCGAESRQPWACPERRDGDDVDHVLVRRLLVGRVPFEDAGEANPFVRFRALSQVYQLARIARMTDAAFCDLVARLDDRVAAIDGAGFRVTDVMAGADGVRAKDEASGGVTGTHKARHLMGIAIYLAVGEALGARDGSQPLAIASCGNAALAAAVIAKAAGRRLTAFIPPDAPADVRERLAELDVDLRICERDGRPGDPTYRAFRAEVASGGALPFCVQGPDCGLTIEGGQTIGWELATALADAGEGDQSLDHVLVQVGGGALATAVFQGLHDAVALGLAGEVPRLHAVQTEACHPVVRAWDRFTADAYERLGRPMPSSRAARAAELLGEPFAVEVGLQRAVRERSRYMWPWEETPRSVAHAMLDDETYDWFAVVRDMVRTGGWPVLVDEEQLVAAQDKTNAARARLGKPPLSPTGAAGVAGLRAARAAGDIGSEARCAVIHSGVRRRDS